MAKNALEGSIKDRIALMWDLHSLGKSQREIATELKTNQKDVSRHLKVRRVCGKLFLDRLPDDIKVEQLVRLSHARELEKREKLDDTPANDFVNAVQPAKRNSLNQSCCVLPVYLEKHGGRHAISSAWRKVQTFKQCTPIWPRSWRTQGTTPVSPNCSPHTRPRSQESKNRSFTYQSSFYWVVTL